MIVIALVFVTPFLAAWMFGYVWLRVSRRRKLERSRDALRPFLEAPVHYERIEDADKLLEAGDDREHEILAQGFELLGDLISPKGRPGARTITRLMASADHSILAFVSKSRLMLASASAAGHEVMTSRTAEQGGFVSPPEVDHVVVPETTTLGALMSQHRFRMAQLPDRRTFRSVDDVLAYHAESRARTLAWRAEQDQDELLMADIRALRGESVAIEKREP